MDDIKIMVSDLLMHIATSTAQVIKQQQQKTNHATSKLHNQVYDVANQVLLYLLLIIYKAQQLQRSMDIERSKHQQAEAELKRTIKLLHEKTRAHFKALQAAQQWQQKYEQLVLQQELTVQSASPNKKSKKEKLLLPLQLSPPVTPPKICITNDDDVIIVQPTLPATITTANVTLSPPPSAPSAPPSPPSSPLVSPVTNSNENSNATSIQEIILQPPPQQQTNAFASLRSKFEQKNASTTNTNLSPRERIQMLRESRNKKE